MESASTFDVAVPQHNFVLTITVRASNRTHGARGPLPSRGAIATMRRDNGGADPRLFRESPR